MGRMWEIRNAYRFWWGDFLENCHLEDQEGDGGLTSTWMLDCKDWRWIEMAQDYVQWGFGIRDVEPSGSASTVLVNSNHNIKAFVLAWQHLL